MPFVDCRIRPADADNSVNAAQGEQDFVHPASLHDHPGDADHVVSGSGGKIEVFNVLVDNRDVTAFGRERREQRQSAVEYVAALVA